MSEKLNISLMPRGSKGEHRPADATLPKGGPRGPTRRKIQTETLPAFGYAAAMPKLWIAVAAIAAGLLVGAISRSALVTMAQWEARSCWKPGLARNIGIAEQGCD
jgi:hypothetical protein